MPPKRSNLVLPTHIPNIELDVLVGDGLDVKPDGRNGCNVLVELELVQDRWRVHVSRKSRRGCRVPPTRLAGGVKAQHQ